MQKYFKNNVWAVVIALVTASIVMMIFESINSLLFPFPEGMDKTDINAVRAFTDSLPSSGYILVILGWVSGSAVGAYMLEKFSKAESKKRNILIMVTILTLIGVFNNVVLGAPTLVNILGLVVFYAGSRLGLCIADRKII